ncbi:hypothetical protein XENTR_v10015078 [Xenopus tropicalis]|nr:hypothetical protein XENTR_v10015078 [Xenopus tropicalis]
MAPGDRLPSPVHPGWNRPGGFLTCPSLLVPGWCVEMGLNHVTNKQQGSICLYPALQKRYNPLPSSIRVQGDKNS